MSRANHRGRRAKLFAALVLIALLPAVAYFFKGAILSQWRRWRMETVAEDASPWSLSYFYSIEGESQLFLFDGRALKDLAWIEIDSTGRVRYAEQPAFADSNFSHKDFQVSAEEAKSVLVDLLCAVPDLRGRYEVDDPIEPDVDPPLLVGSIAGEGIQFRLEAELESEAWPAFERLERMTSEMSWTYDMRVGN